MSDPKSSSSLPPKPQPTEVDLTWIAGKIEHRIVFGRSIAERITDPQHRTVSFAPGTIFGVMRWASSDYGLTVVRLEVLRAPKPGERATRVPFVHPTVEILMRVSGWADVQRAVQIIDAVQATKIDPADTAPDYWLHVGNRLAAGERPRPYTRARHMAWLLRRRLSL
jgi:hypothetical protein